MQGPAHGVYGVGPRSPELAYAVGGKGARRRVGPCGRRAWREESGLGDESGGPREAPRRAAYVAVVADWKCSVKGAWLPGGSATAAPLTVAAKEPGAPAMTVTGPVAVMVCD